MGLTPRSTSQQVPPLVTGRGEPVVLVAHGLGATVAETRPLVSAVPGTRVLPTARGHAGQPLGDEPLSYDLLGRDLEAVADAHGADRALGVSMGAGALLSLLARRPDRFDRLVLVLPAALDAPRTDAAVGRLQQLAAAVAAGDRDGVLAAAREEVPADLRALPGVEAYLASRADALLSSPGVAAALRDLPGSLPVADRSLLGAVTAEVLVVACEGDPLHPAQVGRELAAALPRARLLLFDAPAPALRERARLRAAVGEWLSEP